MSEQRDFPRRLDALPAIVAFTDAALGGAGLSEASRQAVHFGVEELFTNMVKYAPAGGPRITLDIQPVDGAATVTLIDHDVDPFDPTCVPDAAVDRPIAAREAGGLGLHLLRRLVDSLGYAYDAGRREGRTCFRVGAPKKPAAC